MALDYINAHQGEITNIVVSPDQNFLFSSSSDGSLFIFSIKEIKGGQDMNA